MSVKIGRSRWWLKPWISDRQEHLDKAPGLWLN
jgi:hypothetical protein